MLRYVEAQQSKKNCVFSFHCARLALSLQKELKNVENDTVNDGLRQGRCPL